MPHRRPVYTLPFAAAAALIGLLACAANESKAPASAEVPRTWPSGSAHGQPPGGSGAGVGAPAVEPATPAARAKAIAAQIPEGEDVTDEVRRMNSDAFAKPPTTFRAGHVTPRALDPKAISTRGGGFSVKLPSGAPITTPAVYDGRLYVSGGFRSKQFYALDAKTGQPVWGLDLDDDGPSTAACDDGVCVFNTESCTVFAVDAATGKMLWSYWLGDPLMSAPTVAHGRVYTAYPVGGRGATYNNNDNNNAGSIPWQAAAKAPTAPSVGDAKARPPGATHAFVAFDLKTGQIQWQRWIDSDVMSAPVASADEVIATSFAGTLYRFDAASGEVLAAQKARATSAPILVAGKLFYTRRTDAKGAKMAQESLVRQSASTGKLELTASTRSAPWLDRHVQAKSVYWLQGQGNDAANGFAGGAPPAANAGAALDNIGQATVCNLQGFQGSRVLNYAGHNYSSMGDQVISTDPETGDTRWSFKLPGDAAKQGGFLAAPPVAAGRSVIVATLAGKILRLSPETGELLQSWDVEAPVRAQPVVHEGWLYIGTDNGRVIGIDTGDRSLGGWPQWGGDAARTGVM